MNSHSIQQGYQTAARAYALDRQNLKSGKYVTALHKLLKPQSSILDIGCGNGDPVDTALIQKGHIVYGIDSSSTQITWARKNCPQGDFQVKDMTTLKAKEYQVDAVVSMYAIFHIPREKHAQLLRTINTFLPIGGYLLITMGDHDFEGWHNFYGTQMWSSHFGPAKNKKMVQDAGFQLLTDEINTSGGERHQIILARKEKA